MWFDAVIVKRLCDDDTLRCAVEIEIYMAIMLLHYNGEERQLLCCDLNRLKVSIVSNLNAEWYFDAQYVRVLVMTY